VQDKEEGNDIGYQLPDDFENEEGRRDLKKSRESAMTKRYREGRNFDNGDNKNPRSEQEEWEAEQTRKAMGRQTTKGKGGKNDADDYEFVFEDQIDFVMDEIVAKNKRKAIKKKKGGGGGDNSSDEENNANNMGTDNKQKEVANLTEHQKILVGRKKLPVYQYRDEFLAAMQDHQVLILVGETGSGKTTQIPQYLHEVG